MKGCWLRQSLVCLLVGLVSFALVSVSWADGVEVEVPYAATSAQWWTGVAIKNIDKNSTTADIKMEFFDSEGDLKGAVNIAPLAPRAVYSGAITNTYMFPLPESYSIRISHSDSQELAVTLVVGNSATGGYAFQTYSSRICSQTILSWHQIIPTAERFELVMNDEAVLDRETGLVWQRTTSDTTQSWYDAQLYSYDLIINNRKGWRLPTEDELATLLDTTQSDPMLPDGHLFTNVKHEMRDAYWSSTTCSENTDNAWNIYFWDALISVNDKSGSRHYVRAVRSGQ